MDGIETTYGFLPEFTMSYKLVKNSVRYSTSSVVAIIAFVGYDYIYRLAKFVVRFHDVQFGFR